MSPASFPGPYKYTSAAQFPAWFAGGTHDGVPTEWQLRRKILSCFNAYMDADALGLGAMANASFTSTTLLAARYPQNPSQPGQRSTAQACWMPTAKLCRELTGASMWATMIRQRGLSDAFPQMWRDHGATLPHTAFVGVQSPTCGERFRLAMAWAREHRTTNDWFVAGDSGAGYLNPGELTPPRRFSGLPSGLEAWEKHCEYFFTNSGTLV